MAFYFYFQVNKKMPQLERLSNLELLRILSMFGVLTSHSLMVMCNLYSTHIKYKKYSVKNA